MAPKNAHIRANIARQILDLSDYAAVVVFAVDDEGSPFFDAAGRGDTPAAIFARFLSERICGGCELRVQNDTEATP